MQHPERAEPRSARTVDVLLAPPFTPEAVRGAHVVAVDVLRATTTIAFALANGAAGVIPVLTPEDAIELGRRLGRDRVRLCGERDSVLIAGFDLDNSPASYTRDAVEGKTLVFTTTNGTRALRVASSTASVRAAALVNRAAVADALAAERGPIVVLCAGVHGRFAMEDAIGAGALVDAVLARDPHCDLTDGARAAALLYRSIAARLPDAIASAEHAQALAALGFTGDLTTCAALDVLQVVPVLRDGILVANDAAPAAPAPPVPRAPLLGAPPPAEDAASVLARRVEAELPGFRERHGSEYAVRGHINGALLTGALHAYVAIAFREGSADEALRAIGAGLDDVLAADRAGARNLAEDFLERVVDWQPTQREALRRTLGPDASRVFAHMEAPSA